jgi:hypothetical protein
VVAEFDTCKIFFISKQRIILTQTFFFLQYFSRCNVAANLTYCFGVVMQELNMIEIEQVGGAGLFSGVVKFVAETAAGMYVEYAIDEFMKGWNSVA